VGLSKKRWEGKREGRDKIKPKPAQRGMVEEKQIAKKGEKSGGQEEKSKGVAPTR